MLTSLTSATRPTCSRTWRRSRKCLRHCDREISLSGCTDCWSAPTILICSALKLPLVAPSKPKKIKHPACSSSVTSFGKKAFAGDPALVGKTVVLNNNSFTVIGVTPGGFTGIDLGRSPEIFVPMQMASQLGFEPGFTTSRAVRQFSVIGRLNANVSETQADASLDVMARQ